MEVFFEEFEVRSVLSILFGGIHFQRFYRGSTIELTLHVSWAVFVPPMFEKMSLGGYVLSIYGSPLAIEEGQLEHLYKYLIGAVCHYHCLPITRVLCKFFAHGACLKENYLHGIDIVNIADYLSPASRLSSYLLVAIEIAHYEGYPCMLVHDLLNNNIYH